MARKTGRTSFQLTWFGDELAEAVADANEDGLWAMGEVVLSEAQRRAPARSGRLRRSGYVATAARSGYRKQPRDRYRQPRVRAGEVLVAFASYYSKFLERGAGRHLVPAERRRKGERKVLLIEGLGFRRKAQHPGMRRQPFLGPALDALQERASEALADEIRRRVEAAMPRAE